MQQFNFNYLCLFFYVVVAKMNNLKITDVVSKFSGEDGENVEQWLEKLETAVEIFGGKEDVLKLLPLFLKGAAYTTYKQLSNEEKTDFEHIKNSFRRVFGVSKPKAWSQLKEMRFYPGESVDALMDKIEEKLKIISGGKEVPTWRGHEEKRLYFGSEGTQRLEERRPRSNRFFWQ